MKKLWVLLVAVFVTACSANVKIPNVPKSIPPQPGPIPPMVNFSDPNILNELNLWSAKISRLTLIPEVPLKAQALAQMYMARKDPGCGITWTTLAAIGMVESKEGRYHGSRVESDGEVNPKLIGPRLDGTNGTMKIKDTDHGKLDGDPKFDHALGPYQIIPETWLRFGITYRPGVKDPDPNNMYDAAVTAANYLCYQGGDLNTAKGWKAAILSYNNSDWYVDRVDYLANAYSIMWFG